MKILTCSLLLCLSICLSAQDSGVSPQIEPDMKTINFFPMNDPYLAHLDPQEIQLKLPSITAQPKFKTQDTWIMPALDLPGPVCPNGGDFTDGFLGFQTVKTFNFFQTKVVSTFTFDASGNLRSSEISFGGF